MTLARRELVLGLITAVTATPQHHQPMYGMLGKMSTAPGKRDDVVTLLLAAVTAMPGCLSYVIALDAADANGIWITEVWESKERHDASLSLPDVRQSIAAARPFITGFSNQVITTPIGGFGLPRPLR